MAGLPAGECRGRGVSAAWISRKDLEELMERWPELRFSISPWVDPARPEALTVYAWHVGDGTAQLHRHYSVYPTLPREVALVVVDAQIRMAGRRFDVQAWEAGRLARLRQWVA